MSRKSPSEQKAEAVVGLHDTGDVLLVAEDMNISDRTLYKWRKALWRRQTVQHSPLRCCRNTFEGGSPSQFRRNIRNKMAQKVARQFRHLLRLTLASTFDVTPSSFADQPNTLR